MNTRKSVPINLRKRLWEEPCVICGDRGDIEIDHIVPVARGGGSDESNLQPLCHQCHMRKGRLSARSNAELLEMYRANRALHHLRNKYRIAIRFLNPYDAISFDAWRVTANA